MALLSHLARRRLALALSFAGLLAAVGCDAGGLTGPESPPAAAAPLIEIAEPTVGLRAVTIQWRAENVPADAQFEVIRQSQYEETEQTVARVRGAREYVDADVIVGVTYYYRVRLVLSDTALVSYGQRVRAGLQIPTAAGIRDVVYDPGHNRVFVAVYDDPFDLTPTSKLVVIDAGSLAVEREIAIDAGPYAGPSALTLSADGETLLVSIQRAGTVLLVDTDDFSMRTVDVSGATGNLWTAGTVEVAPNRFVVWATTYNGGHVNGEAYAHLAWLDLSGEPTTSRILSQAPEWAPFVTDPVGGVVASPVPGHVVVFSRMYPTDILHVDLTSGEAEVSSQATLDGVLRAVPLAGRVFTQYGQVLDPKTLGVLGTTPPGRPLAVGGTVWIVPSTGVDVEHLVELDPQTLTVRRSVPILVGGGIGTVSSQAPLAFVAERESVFVVPLDG